MEYFICSIIELFYDSQVHFRCFIAALAPQRWQTCLWQCDSLWLSDEADLRWLIVWRFENETRAARTDSLSYKFKHDANLSPGLAPYTQQARLIVEGRIKISVRFFETHGYLAEIQLLMQGVVCSASTHSEALFLNLWLLFFSSPVLLASYVDNG